MIVWIYARETLIVVGECGFHFWVLNGFVEPVAGGVIELLVNDQQKNKDETSPSSD